MFILSPLEQFKVIPIFSTPFTKTLDLSLSNSAIFLILSLIIIISTLHSSFNKGKIIPNRWQQLSEEILLIIQSLSSENLGSKKGFYFPFLITLFLLLLTLNIIGLIPYTFSVTAQIIITLSLSFSIWLIITQTALWKYGFNYLATFIPSHTPLWLASFLIGIEILSNLARALSLGVRLAANITSGHILLGIISSFIWVILLSPGIIKWTFPIPFILLLALNFLELGVAFIQAYVFTLLTSIYLNDGESIH